MKVKEESEKVGLKLNLEKVEEPEIKFPHPLHYQKSKQVPEKYQLLLY